MSENRFVFYLLAIVSGVVGAYGDGLLNYWAKKDGGLGSLLGGFCCCNVALALFAYMLRTGGLAQVVVIFLVANSVVVLFMSHFYFSEAISIQKWLGIICALVGIIVMELG